MFIHSPLYDVQMCYSIRYLVNIGERNDRDKERVIHNEREREDEKERVVNER